MVVEFFGPKDLYSWAKRGAESVNELTDNLGGLKPLIMLVLGSGCGGVADKIEVVASVDYGDITGMPESTVMGHEGRLIIGMYGGKPVLGFKGRVHFYEGYSAQQVSFPVYLAKHLGVEMAIMTNAAGIAPSPKPWWNFWRSGNKYPAKKGDVLLTKSYNPNLLPSSLRGPRIEGPDPRFKGAINVPSVFLGQLAREAAVEMGISLKDGIYVPRQGPNYETPVEIELLTELSRITGLPVAGGMSTVPSLEAANELGIDTLGLTVVTNQCFNLRSRDEIEGYVSRELARRGGASNVSLAEARELSGEAIGANQPSHDEVAEVAGSDEVSDKLEALIGGIVRKVRF